MNRCERLFRILNLWIFFVAISAPACVLAACGTSARNGELSVNDAAAADSVTFSFVTVGCNRVGWTPKNQFPLPVSTANEAQLLQTFKDIKALPRAPEYLFLTGDIVRNEQSGATLRKQLDLWQGLWDNGALANGKTTLAPITGNHEVLKGVQSTSFYETPDPGSINEWLNWLDKNKHPPQPGNGPTATTDPNDLLRDDNSQLTYSFDATTSDGKQVHFIILDTDTESSFSTSQTSCYQDPKDETMSQHVPGWVPLNWVKQDLSNNSRKDLIFAFGHKPLVWPGTLNPATSSSDGRDTIFNCEQKMLAKELFTAFDASANFVAYLCAHKHLWDASQIQSAVWQVVAGNGGSELDFGASPSFGFTLVENYKSGKVIATAYTRAVPTPYYNSVGVKSATASPKPIILKGQTGN